jgi:hypothetical protein
MPFPHLKLDEFWTSTAAYFQDEEIVMRGAGCGMGDGPWAMCDGRWAANSPRNDFRERRMQQLQQQQGDERGRAKKEREQN